MINSADNALDSSTAEGLTAEAVTALLPNKVKKLMAEGKLKVVRSIEDLPRSALNDGEALYHTAWHGSPYDHSKFDSSKIGTGEGEAVFGHGNYFTDAKNIGEWYRDSLATKRPYFTIGNINYSYNPVSSQSSPISKRYTAYNTATKESNYITKKEFEEKQSIAAKGKLYEVELAPTQDEYLDWNKSLSEQSQLVTSALEKKFSLPSFDSDFRAAGEFYRSRKRQFDSDVKASQELQSLGIRGIRYQADNGNSPASNYVVFDDNDISITNKYSADMKGAEGLYNRKTDTMYLFASSLTKDTLPRVLAHELFHRALAIDPQLKAVTARFDAGFQRSFDAASNGIGSPEELNAYHRVIAAETPLRNQLEEFKAYLVTQYVKTPDSFVGQIKRLFLHFIASVRMTLLRAGLDAGSIQTLSTADLFVMSGYGAKGSAVSMAPLKETGKEVFASALASLSWGKDRIASLLSQNAYTGNDNKTKAFAAFIDVDDFLRATTTPKKDSADSLEAIIKETTPFDIKRLQEESQVMTLWGDLTGDTFTINDHEGRHRVSAIKSFGISQVPVVFVVDGNARDYPSALRNLIIKGQEIRPNEKGDDFKVATGMPINYSNLEAVNELFNKDNGLQFSAKADRFYSALKRTFISAPEKIFGKADILMDGLPLFSKAHLLAPNGKPSNLNAMQHAQVRTPEFIKWFGDWLNDAENASKIVDENGEPLVVFHGSKANFSEFDTDKAKIGWLGKGFYFTSNIKTAKSYGAATLKTFLNIRKPFEVTGEGPSDVGYEIKKKYNLSHENAYNDVSITLKENEMDGITFKHWEQGNIFSCFASSQIKSATSNNGQFSESNDNIRYSVRDNAIDQVKVVSKSVFSKENNSEETGIERMA